MPCPGSWEGNSLRAHLFASQRTSRTGRFTVLWFIDTRLAAAKASTSRVAPVALQSQGELRYRVDFVELQSR